jgi:4a-hydroxytetrahydrobiopterin dehydratase
LILDGANVVRYFQLVAEITRPPDYEAALAALAAVIKNPRVSVTAAAGRCKPCEGGVLAFTKNMIERELPKYQGWESVDDRKIVKEFKFKDFAEAKYFLDMVSMMAQDQGHHPLLTLMYNKVKVTLTTHVAGGVTENDFVMAGIIDQMR